MFESRHDVCSHTYMCVGQNGRKIECVNTKTMSCLAHPSEQLLIITYQEFYLQKERRQKTEIMQLTCRFYKNQFPETEDLVMVNVTEIEEMGVYVNLLEYNNRQGSIAFVISIGLLVNVGLFLFL